MRYVLLSAVAVALSACPALAQEWDGKGPIKPVMAAQVDLNGDGKPESIRLTRLKNPRYFCLQVNAATVTDHLSDDVTGFYIINVNRADRYKEVVVYTPGPSDDDEHLLFWFDGQRLRKMGRLARWPDYLGNGIVLVRSWQGWWEPVTKYVLGKDRTLVVAPQEFQAVGVKATATRPVPLYQRRKSHKLLANLAKGSKAEILLWDPAVNWYLVKSERGLLGWLDGKKLLFYFQEISVAD